MYTRIYFQNVSLRNIFVAIIKSQEFRHFFERINRQIRSDDERAKPRVKRDTMEP